MAFPYVGFMITLIGHATIGRTPLDELSAQRRNLYRATHNNHMTQIPMPSAGFELTTPTSELLADPRLGSRTGQNVTQVFMSCVILACDYFAKRS